MSFATSSQPQGVSVLLLPSSLSGQATTSSLLLRVDNLPTTGASTFTLTATGAGVSNASARIPLTIRPQSIGAAPIIVPQGNSATVRVVVSRQGYTGSIIMSVIDLQSPSVGTTLSPQSPQIGTPASQLTITTSPAQPIDPFTLTVRATSFGIEPVTVAIPVTVVATEAPDVTLSVKQRVRTRVRADDSRCSEHGTRDICTEHPRNWHWRDHSRCTVDARGRAMTVSERLRVL